MQTWQPHFRMSVNSRAILCLTTESESVLLKVAETQSEMAIRRRSEVLAGRCAGQRLPEADTVTPVLAGGPVSMFRVGTLRAGTGRRRSPTPASGRLAQASLKVTSSIAGRSSRAQSVRVATTGAG